MISSIVDSAVSMIIEVEKTDECAQVANSLAVVLMPSLLLTPYEVDSSAAGFRLADSDWIM